MHASKESIMAGVPQVQSKGRRPSGDQRYIVTAAGSIVVNVRRLVGTDQARRIAAAVKRRKDSGELKFVLSDSGSQG